MIPFAHFTLEYRSKSSYTTLYALGVGLILFAAVFFSSAVALAGRSVLDTEQQMTDLIQKLQLSDEQAKQVRPICEETIQKIRKLMLQTLIPALRGQQATR